ncbi:MAG: WGR domain-containing protein [Acidimicrobiales bacterium]
MAGTEDGVITLLPLPHLLPSPAPQAPYPPASSPPARAAIRERGSGGEGICLRGRRRPDPAEEAHLAALQHAVAEASAVVVRRVDEAGEGSKARWYRVAVQPTLDGGVDLVREWGRLPVGQTPRRLVSPCAGWDEVQLEVRRVLARRLRRGYTVHRA